MTTVNLSIEEFDEIFWRQDDLSVPFTDGIRVDAAELAAYNAARSVTTSETEPT